MEIILTSNGGKARRVTLNGRTYVAVPLTMIVSGVLNGSAGRLFYPVEEIEKDPSAWNGMPVVLNHPLNKEGRHVSGRTPETWNSALLGHLFNVKAENGKLTGEAYLDVQACKRIDNRLLQRIENGQPVEISTGLFTESTPAPEGATYNGEPYEYIARNYRPDHLAILPDEKGACSNADGCGINVNRKGATVTTRKSNLAWLTANCSCWEQGALGELTDRQIASLKANVEKAHQLVLIVNAKKKGAANADGEEEAAGVDIASLGEFLGIGVDPASDPVGYTKELGAKLTEILTKLGLGAAPEAPAAAQEEPPPEEEEPVAMEEPKPDPDLFPIPEAKGPEGSKNDGASHGQMVGDKAARNSRRRRPLTDDELIAMASPTLKAMIANYKQREKTERVELLKVLLGNTEGEARKKAFAAYQRIDTETLRIMAQGRDEYEEPAAPAPLYFGAAAPIGNRGQVTDEDLEEIEAMTPPVMNFRKERA